ncbi:MAG TPA: hypothetical protein VFW62_06060, partial [bacterium]|nr:hypothetical protein [bacterium]
RIERQSEFVLRFSERIDLASLEKDAVALFFNAEEEIFLDIEDLMEDLASGELATVPSQFLLDAEEKELSLLPEGELADGIYHLVITPALLSVKGLPFNQKPGESPQLFIARYLVGEGELPQLGETPSGPAGPPPPIFGPGPDTLVIHELLYDGKVSETDGEAFVELYGTADADISLYQVLFLNGSNGEETERITLPPHSILGEDGIFLIADLKTGSTSNSGVAGADFLDQFDPQNGPDGLQLLNREGELLDTVVYGEGSVALAANGLALGEGLPALDVAGGHSLSRLAGADSGDNRTDFLDQTMPSPGSL